jgi:hypothetical protein
MRHVLRRLVLEKNLQGLRVSYAKRIFLCQSQRDYTSEKQTGSSKANHDTEKPTSVNGNLITAIGPAHGQSSSLLSESSNLAANIQGKSNSTSTENQTSPRDTATTEPVKNQFPSPSSHKSVEPSKATAAQLKDEEPWHFILPDSEPLPIRNHLPPEVLAQTSLRKRLVWQEPLSGVNPAYDLALEFVNQEKQRVRAIIETLEKRINEAKQSIPTK